MMDERLHDLLERLSKKTIKRDVVWTLGSGNNSFKVLLNKGMLEISAEFYGDPFVEVLTRYIVSVYNNDGNRIGGFAADEGEEYADVLSNLHQLARASHFKADETYEEMLKELESDGVVGQDNNEVADTNDEEELPF